MPAIRTGYACPQCQRQTGDVNEVTADGGRLRCSKVSEHQWNDMLDFIELKPVIAFKQQQAAPQAQPGHIDITVKVPLSVRNAITQKYGDKADGIVAGILLMMAEGECLVVRETDISRIASVLPEKPKDSSHLFGLIMALKFQLDEAKQSAELAGKEVKAYEGMSPGMVMLNLGDQFGNAKQRAEAENLPIKVFLEKSVRTALENNWW